MIKSRVDFLNGRARLVVDEVPQAACAYITYFDERTHCKDFANVGFKLFSLCASFSGLPLNSVTGFSPLFGIFDVKGKPDYSRFDSNVREIIKHCPDAMIFPRVRVSMPLWWINEHPNEVCESPCGDKREALFSDEFRKSGADMLRELIAHIHASDYAEHIIGYQIAGGSTEEWFHFDTKGSLSACSERKFNEYLLEKYPDESDGKATIPNYDILVGEKAITDINAQRYLEFISFSVAQTVAYFANVAKKCVSRQQIVGAFFGYVQDIPNPLRGSIGLKLLLDCSDIDFFCSPASYVDMRSLGKDWGEHCAGESIKLHRKLYFIENDVRTCLSKIPGECRLGVDPLKKYTSPLWLGPPSVELSVSAIRKAYARQLTHANAMWWFDMWGGWYACDTMMNEIKRSLDLLWKLTISEAPTSRADVAVLFDEKYPFRIGEKHPCFLIQKKVHDRLGNTGMTFDAFLTEDYHECLKYQAVLFPFPDAFDTKEIKAIKQYLTENDIPFVQLTLQDFDISADELRYRLIDAGAHCYCDTGDVVYFGNGYLAVHAASRGIKKISFPDVLHITPLDKDGEEIVSSVLEISMEQFETLLFEVRKA